MCLEGAYSAAAVIVVPNPLPGGTRTAERWRPGNLAEDFATPAGTLTSAARSGAQRIREARSDAATGAAP